MRFLIYFFVFLAQFSFVLAHHGGHSANEEQQVQHIWRYANGRMASKGAILSINGPVVYFEEPNQVVTSILINELSLADQELVMSNVLQVRLVNNHATMEPAFSAFNSQKWKPAIIPIGILLLLLLFIILRNIGRLRAVLIIFGGFGLSFIHGCTDQNQDPDEMMDLTNDPVYMESSFSLYPESILGTSHDENYFYVATNSIPDHQMMVGITAWIAQVPVPHYYTGDQAWSIPLKPAFSSETITIEDDLRRGPIAVASNGIAVFNPVNASGLVSKDIGELDEYGGHSGRGDDYHYHIAPLHLESTSGHYPIAYGLDGFPVYGSSEPDGADMQSLDEYHGHVYHNQYHYHGTTDYPFLIAKMRGIVTLTGTSPETQIEPQPMNTPVRGDPRGIGDYRPGDPDFEITDFQPRTEGVGYVLTYEYQGKVGSLEYYWDENELFTYIFNDPDGTIETQVFQR